jgi:DNA-binding MarR family transcriptional regulator
MMFKELDPLLHSQLRLSIISLLIGVKSGTFAFLQEKTGASKGNISVQLKKLEEAGYIEIDKSFKDNYPRTTCKITEKGVSAFKNYVDALKEYLRDQEPGIF